MKTKPALPAPLVTPVFFKVPPASLKSFQNYADYLYAEKAPYAAVITRATFDPTKTFQINFDYVASLKNEDAELIKPLIDSPQTRRLIGMMPEMGQIEDHTPDLPQSRETGFAAAFAGQKGPSENTTNLPVKRGPGRPKKPSEQPAQPAASAEAAEEPAEGAQENASWEEPDDANLDKMMGNVLGNMMPK